MVEGPVAGRTRVPDRYDRQTVLPEVGHEGQWKLASARVLVVGLGGLGSPAGLYLAGAGVGTLGLCDFDKVDVTNLHRQPLYTTADVGWPKVEVAAARLQAIDPALQLVRMPGPVDIEDAAKVVAGWDVVLDCTDDMEARYALSDACAAAHIPLVHGAVSQWEGECTVFWPPKGPCYRCLYPVPPTGPAATCATEGVLGTVPGIVGTWQAQETLKILLGVGEPLVGRMVLLDAKEGNTRTIALKRREGCTCTVAPPVACPLPWAAPQVPTISAEEYEAQKGEVFLLDVREPDEFEEMRIPGATLVPLGSLPGQLALLPRDRTIVCLCAVGGRSAQAAQFLNQQGFRAVNMRGGMRAWLASQA